MPDGVNNALVGLVSDEDLRPGNVGRTTVQGRNDFTYTPTVKVIEKETYPVSGYVDEGIQKAYL